MSFDWPAAKNEARERLGEDFDRLRLDSKLCTSKAVVPKNVSPLVMPIYHSSTYCFSTIKQYGESNHGENCVYRRCGNPTTDNVEVALREIEGGAGTLVYNSGLLATQAVLLEFLSAGDHLIGMKPMYSGSYSFITETLSRFNVELSFVNVETEENFTDALIKQIKPNTKLIFLEVLSNPTMAMPNLLSVIEAVDNIRKDGRNLKICIDATFASPIAVQPLGLGADFSLHSCSKYIGGHSDVIAGCLSAKSKEDWERLKLQQLTTGSSLSPFDASLIARGIQTLQIRVERISATAQKVAAFLENHPKVVSVSYPGLKSHKQHEAASKYMKFFGGMIAFDVGSASAAIAIVENVRLISHAVSLGGTESLIEHPATMSHGAQLLRGEEEKTTAMVGPGVLRFSIGLEHPDDIIHDLEHALGKI